MIWFLSSVFLFQFPNHFCYSAWKSGVWCAIDLTHSWQSVWSVSHTPQQVSYRHVRLGSVRSWNQMSSSLYRRTTSVTICQVIQQNSTLFQDMHKPVNATANETCVVSCAGRHHVCNYPDRQRKQSEGLHCVWIGPCWLVNGLQVQTPSSVSVSRHVACVEMWLKILWVFKRLPSPCVSRLQVVWVCGRMFSQCRWTTSLTPSTDRRWASPTWPLTSACEERPPPHVASPTLHSTDLLQYS